MKRTLIISLLVAAMGMIAFIGCERHRLESPLLPNTSWRLIAFVGNGLDVYYPREHKELLDMISQNGAVISQFPPGTPPLKYHFPMRNRLIAAWSDELQVFGAGRNSGTRYTVEYFC